MRDRFMREPGSGPEKATARLLSQLTGSQLEMLIFQLGLPRAELPSSSARLIDIAEKVPDLCRRCGVPESKLLEEAHKFFSRPANESFSDPYGSFDESGSGGAWRRDEPDRTDAYGSWETDSYSHDEHPPIHPRREDRYRPHGGGRFGTSPYPAATPTWPDDERRREPVRNGIRPHGTRGAEAPSSQDINIQLLDALRGLDKERIDALAKRMNINTSYLSNGSALERGISLIYLARQRENGPLTLLRLAQAR